MAGNCCPEYEWNLKHPLFLSFLEWGYWLCMFAKIWDSFFNHLSSDLTHLNAFSFTNIKSTFHIRSGIQATLKWIILICCCRNSSQKCWGNQQEKGPDQNNTLILQANVVRVIFSPLTEVISASDIMKNPDIILFLNWKDLIILFLKLLFTS